MSRTHRIAACLMAVWIAAIVIGAVLLHNHSTRATVPKVSAAARKGSQTTPARALARRIDGLGFPDFSSLEWTAQGGRADVVGGRKTGTVYYVQSGGRSVVSYTLVAGPEKLDDAAGAVVRERATPHGKVALTWQGTGGADPTLIARFVRRGHPVVLTGRPATNAVRSTMTAMAAASFDAG
jgi:hypothetical protein